jgi:hypothetical protein
VGVTEYIFFEMSKIVVGDLAITTRTALNKSFII